MNRNVLFFLAIIFIQNLFASSKPPTKRDVHRDQRIDRAFVFYKKGFLEDAEALYRAVLQQNPKDVEGFFGLGNVYFKKQEWGKAYDFYLQAVEIQPNKPTILLNTALCLLKTGQHIEAISYLEKAAQLNVGNPKILKFLSSILQTTEQHEKALLYLRVSLALSPGNPDILLMIGGSLKVLGKFSESFETFKSVIKKDPNNVHALLEIANIHMAQKEYDQAISCYKNILEFKPHLKQVRRTCASLLKSTNRANEIIELYESILDKQFEEIVHLQDDFSNCTAIEELVDAMIMLKLQEKKNKNVETKEATEKKYKKLYTKIKILEKQYKKIGTPKKLQELSEYLTEINTQLLENIFKKNEAEKKIQHAKKFKRYLKNEIKNLVSFPDQKGKS